MGKIIFENNNTAEVESAGESKIIDKGNPVNVSKQDDFAGAFPKWDLVPPLQVIKRVRRTL